MDVRQKWEFDGEKKNGKVEQVKKIIPKALIPEEPACYFLDEVNLYFRGVEYERNRINHSGIEDFCALARHFDKKVFFVIQRPNQL